MATTSTLQSDSTTMAFYSTSIPSTLNSTVNTTDYYYYDYSNFGFFQDCSIYCIYVLRHRHKLMNVLVQLTSLLTVLALFGIVGNLMVIAVFLRSRSKHNSMYLMLFLAFVDLVTCSIVIPGIIFMEWRFEFYYDALCKIMSFLRYSVIPMSAMILVAIAVDRFVLICTPPHIRLTKFATKVIMAVILVIGMSFGVPPMLAIKVWAKSYDRDRYFGFCVSVYDTITIKQLDDYWYVVTALFVFMILCMITLYFKVFVTVFKQNKKWIKVRKNKVAPTKSVPTMDDNSTGFFSERPGSTETNGKPATKACETTFSETNQSTFTVNGQRRRKESVLDFDHVMKFDDQRYAPKTHPRYSARANSDFTGSQSTIQQRFQRHSLVEKPNLFSHSSSVMNQIEESKRELNQENQARGKNPLNVSPGKQAIQMEEVRLTHMRSISMVHHPRELNLIRTFSMTNALGDRADNLPLKQTSAVKGKESIQLKKKVSILVQETRKSQPEKCFSVAGRSRPTHIKTTQVLFIVTIVYIAAFLPTFLMSNHLIPTHKVLYYIYFLNNAANPLIYSFMNPRFRQEVKNLFTPNKRTHR